MKLSHRSSSAGGPCGATNVVDVDHHRHGGEAVMLSRGVAT